MDLIIVGPRLRGFSRALRTPSSINRLAAVVE
jgi:hypothetical protein